MYIAGGRQLGLCALTIMNSKTSLEKDDSVDVSVAVKPVVAASDLDVAAHVTAGKDVQVDPQEAARIR